MSDSLSAPAETNGAAKLHEPPLTVLQLVPRLDGGGVERGTIEIAEAIVRGGGRALVATAGGALERRLKAVGAEVTRMNAASKNPLDILQNGWLLARLIADCRVDVVHARSRAPAWSGWIAAGQAKVPFVTTYHGAYNEGFALKRRYNAIMAKGRPVIAPSSFIRDMIVARHGLPAEDIVVIPRGADLRIFSEDRVSGHRAVKLATEWGLIDDTRPVIMLPGRLTRWKGAESVIDAARLLSARRGPDFVLLIVGGETKPGFRSLLDRRIADAGLENTVRCTGPCADMAAAYRLCSVVLSASIEPEAFGRVAVEAQAMGRPVIATDHGGARETVVEGETGWLYPPGDAQALADRLEHVLSLAEEARVAVGRAGRDWIARNFTVTAMQRRTLAVYEGVTGKHFQPPG